MGYQTERYREMIKHIPKSASGLVSPNMAYRIIIQIANDALQTIVELEERNEDLSKEVERLTEMLIEHNGAPEWGPNRID